MTANSEDSDYAEADLLALHVAAGQPERIEAGRALGFGPVAERDAGDEEHAHHGEDGPALPLVADHAAEDVGQRRADREDRDHLHEVRQRASGSRRDARQLALKKPPPLVPSILMAICEATGPDGDRLLGALERRRVDIRPERLRHALPDEEERVDDADRQQDVERAAGDIDPEVADGLCGGARKAADQRDGEHDAGGRRQEVLVRQAEHLHEVGHRAFAAVVLPVGVGDEADGGVEGQVRRHGRHAGRIVRQRACSAQQNVEDEESADVKEQHGDRIGEPVLLALGINATQQVETGFDRHQHRAEERALAVEDPRHVAAERLHQCDDDRAVKKDLKSSR